MRVERAMETGDIPMALRHLATLIRFGKLVEEDADTLISLAFAVSVVEDCSVESRASASMMHGKICTMRFAWPVACENRLMNGCGLRELKIR